MNPNINPRTVMRTAWSIAAGGAAVLAIALFLSLFAPPPRDARADEVGQLTCSKTAFYDASTNGLTKIITAATTGSDRIYICGYTVNVGAAAVNVALKYGTGTNCATNTTSLTPTWVLPIAGQLIEQHDIWTGLVVPLQTDLCVFTSAGQAAQVQVYYSTRP
jgi:hypothetical protein